MDGSFLTSKRGVSSMVALLIAASATIIYLTTGSRRLTSWGSLSADGEHGEGEEYVEDSDSEDAEGSDVKQSERRRKRPVAAAASGGEGTFVDPKSAFAITKVLEDLKRKRFAILKSFEDSGHREIPAEMADTMDHIHSMTASDTPPQIRLMCSQLIQDYAIMQTNIDDSRPDTCVVDFAKEWLCFEPLDAPMRVEQINHRYALALRSRSMKEFEVLFSWLQGISKEETATDSIYENWVLRNFQCCCLLGKWGKVLKFGRMLEGINPEKLAAQSGQKGSTAPLHPLHLFEYIALKLPNQSANFTQAYYHCEKYALQFDSRMMPPLKFTEWAIKDCTTQLVEGICTNPLRHSELQLQISRIKAPTKVAGYAKCMFVYGVLVQFPCYWVQLPAAKDKMQPVVMCGPWNDTEMEMTASYVRRLKTDSDEFAAVKAIAGASAEDEKSAEAEGSRMLLAVRSDLRLNLVRYSPSRTGNLERDRDQHLADGMAVDSGAAADGGSSGVSAAKKRVGSHGWLWKGTFEHEEGVMQVKETALTDFGFRRDHEWKSRAQKFTLRTWDIEMIMVTPD